LARRRSVSPIAAPHGVAHLVGVEEHLAVDVAGGAADRLDQAPLAAEEAGLVGVEDRHQRHLRQVEALAQQVDAHQHVEVAQAQVADDHLALDRVDVAVQVADADALLGQVLGQVLGHPLGEGGDEHPLVRLRALARREDDVVDLAARRLDDDLRVDQPGGPDHLLDDLVRQRQLLRGRGRRHEHDLADALEELVLLAGAGCRARPAAGSRSRPASACAPGRRCTCRAAAAP
jgi:hypothetical protein